MMNKQTRVRIALIGSLLVCLIGIYRLSFESQTTTAYIVSFIFAVTGFIGTVGNTVILRKVDS